ncbi:MAG: hypothetical protein P9L99_04785 [Candidatus Lernaella stagnicola]|nr:hypothetical protein [Candidatus Lernaella stagnicola]
MSRRGFFSIRLAWLLVLVLLVFVVVGCGGDDDDDDDDDNDDQSPTDDDTTGDDDTADDDDTTDDDTGDDDTTSPADPYCEEGKQLLRAGAGPLAALQFRAGLELDEDALDCRYGLVLADTLHQFDTYSIIYAYVEMFLGYQPPAAADDDWPQTGQAFLDELLNRLLDGLLIDASDETIANVEWLRLNAPDVVYPLDRMPIILNFEEVCDAHGDFDLPDAVAAEAWAGIVPGLLGHLPALNLDFDLGLVFELTELNFDDDIIEVIGTIVDYLLRLFDNPFYPDFFTLKDDGQLFVDAGAKVGLGFQHAEEVFALLVAETGGQENEVLGFADLNDDGIWQPGESLVVQPWGELDQDEMQAADAFRVLFGQMAASFLDYSEYDSTPGTPEPFRLAYLNPILRAFGIPGLIPDSDLLVIDFGAAYQDVDPTSLRDTLVTILRIADLFLP